MRDASEVVTVTAEAYDAQGNIENVCHSHDSLKVRLFSLPLSLLLSVK